jgi:hypothetical protein
LVSRIWTHAGRRRVAEAVVPTTPHHDGHLRVEFERRLRTFQQAGEEPDPRDAQITRLKNEITALKHRLNGSTSTINELTDFRTQALARLAAQHDEITQLRNVLARAHKVRPLPQHEVTSSAPSEVPGRDE